jgi:hypothetical protein
MFSSFDEYTENQATMGDDRVCVVTGNAFGFRISIFRTPKDYGYDNNGKYYGIRRDRDDDIYTYVTNQMMRLPIILRLSFRTHCHHHPQYRGCLFHFPQFPVAVCTTKFVVAVDTRQ